MMEIYHPRNTLAPMPQPHTVTTRLVPYHKAPYWCTLLYPVVVVTSMHQCCGTLCLQYCRISQMHPGKLPTHCLLEDDSGFSELVSQPSSSMLQMSEVSPGRSSENMPTSPESNRRSRSPRTLNHPPKLLQMAPISLHGHTPTP